MEHVVQRYVQDLEHEKPVMVPVVPAALTHSDGAWVFFDLIIVLPSPATHQCDHETKRRRAICIMLVRHSIS